MFVLSRNGEEAAGQFLWEGDCFYGVLLSDRLRGTTKTMSNDMVSQEGLRGSGLSRLGGHMDRLGLAGTCPPLD